MKNNHRFALIQMVCQLVIFVGLLVFALASSGCSTLEIGAGYSPAALGGEEVKLESPIGYIGGTKRWFEDGELSVDTFVRHYSGMLQQETGGGFNVVGVQATINFNKLGR